MKKTLTITVLVAIALLSGCTSQPMPNSVGGGVEQKTSTLSGNDVTALGFKFGSLFHIGNTITITNGDGQQKIK